MKEKVDKRVLGYYRTQTEKRKRWHLEDTKISYKKLHGRAGFLCDRRRIDNGSMNGRYRKGKKTRWVHLTEQWINFSEKSFHTVI